MELTYIQSRCVALGAIKFETIAIFADKVEAEKFYQTEKDRLGKDFEVKIISVIAKEFEKSA